MIRDDSGIAVDKQGITDNPNMGFLLDIWDDVHYDPLMVG